MNFRLKGLVSRRSFFRKVLKFIGLNMLAQPTVYLVGVVTMEERGSMVAGAKTWNNNGRIVQGDPSATGPYLGRGYMGSPCVTLGAQAHTGFGTGEMMYGNNLLCADP